MINEQALEDLHLEDGEALLFTILSDLTLVEKQELYAKYDELEEWYSDVHEDYTEMCRELENLELEESEANAVFARKMEILKKLTPEERAFLGYPC
jgi:hypothetical protein